MSSARKVFYWPNANRLVYLHAKATPEFWDARWRSEGKPPVISPKDDVVVVTKKLLSPGAVVLEGGCGRANKVKALADVGFNAIGLDFAEESVNRARLDYPDLDIRKGDVRSLDLESASLDAYWSIGVIEHFWTGYDAILAEAARVLKPGGFLLLTAPWFSPYRKRLARTGGYPALDFSQEPEDFYQFALSREEVSAQIVAHGFKLRRWSGRVSEICMREDMRRFRPAIDWLIESRGSILKRVTRRIVANGLNRYCGHSFLAVAQRT